ncbi:hypothetical protein UC8_40910 [Roseimaritima ulvae]|uniref:Uncharacterized protein n=1 Tax=Roseimaritima ulvae TaxID=980254 RepID=A0A5B9R6A8_9BACT|nr:hypothetical protein UC8_40910 [Roseimaritima ulvae]
MPAMPSMPFNKRFWKVCKDGMCRWFSRVRSIPLVVFRPTSTSIRLNPTDVFCRQMHALLMLSKAFAGLKTNLTANSTSALKIPPPARSSPNLRCPCRSTTVRVEQRKFGPRVTSICRSNSTRCNVRLFAWGFSTNSTTPVTAFRCAGSSWLLRGRPARSTACRAPPLHESSEPARDQFPDPAGPRQPLGRTNR